MPRNEKKICIVIPLYNEVKRIQGNTLIDDIKKSSYDFILVDDGSDDATCTYIQDNIQGYKNIEILKLESNQGKAQAVRYGINVARKKQYHHVGYLDADLSTPLSAIASFVEIFSENKDVSMVMGCRLKRLGANVKRAELRHFLGRAFATIVSWMIGVGVYDTQCGAKVFKKEIFEIFDEPFESRWLFDVELLLRLRSMNYDLKKSCYEFPLQKWIDLGDSRLKLTDFVKVPLELLRIWKRY